MRKFLPLLFLFLFMLSDAFLKIYVKNAISFDYAFLFVPALILFLFGLGYLCRYLVHSPENKNFWNELTISGNQSRENLWIPLLILLAGTVLRFWRLDSLVDGMLWDEGYKGLDAIAIREFGERPVFLNWNAGREAMVAYLVAGSQHFWDYSVFSVRVVQAFAGSLTILFFYLFVKTIFNRNLALLSAFLMAFSKWHLIHTRYGIRVALMVLFEITVLYFLARGLLESRNKRWFIVLAGVLTGLGFYTYIAYRVFPFVLIAFALDSRIRTQIRKHLKYVVAGLLASLLLSGPLVAFFAGNPESFTDRMKRTAVWTHAGGAESPALVILQSTASTLGMFTFRGDGIARLNVDSEPMLSPFATSFFVLGIILALLHIRKPYALFLLVYFLLSLLPGFLSGQAPHSSRTLGCLPSVMLFISFGISAAVRIVEPYSETFGKVFLALILGGNLLTGPNDALFRYTNLLDHLPPEESALWGMEREESNVAELLNILGNRCDAFLSPQFYYHAGLEYLTFNQSSHKLFNPVDFVARREKGKVTMVILQPEEMNLWWMRDDPGKEFFKWWRQYHGMDVKRIRKLLRQTYPGTGRFSDRTLLQWLQETYPSGRIIDLGRFCVFLVREPAAK
jgi:hypothetical protein